MIAVYWLHFARLAFLIGAFEAYLVFYKHAQTANWKRGWRRALTVTAALLAFVVNELMRLLSFAALEESRYQAIWLFTPVVGALIYAYVIRRSAWEKLKMRKPSDQ